MLENSLSAIAKQKFRFHSRQYILYASHGVYSSNHPNFPTQRGGNPRRWLAKPNWSKSFFCSPCAVLRPGPSKADRPNRSAGKHRGKKTSIRRKLALGGFPLADNTKFYRRGRETERDEKRIREKRKEVPKTARAGAGTGLVSVRLSIVLATVAEHIAPEKTSFAPAKLTPSFSFHFLSLSRSLGPSLLLSLFFFYSLQRVRTDHEPISHYNGCSQDGSKVKLTCSTLFGAKNRARAHRSEKDERNRAKKRMRRE